MAPSETAGIVCLIATAVAVGALVALHLLPTALSPFHHAVSQYGITRYRLGYRVQTIAFGVAAAAAAVGLAQAAPGRAHALIALVVVFAIARFVISWFPMDEPDGEPTNHGRMHALIAVVTIVAIAVAAWRLSTVATQVTGWTTVSTVSALFGWLMVASFVAMVVTAAVAARSGQPIPRYFGAAERALYLAVVGWLVLLGVALI